MIAEPPVPSAAPDLQALYDEQRGRYRAAPYPSRAERTARLTALARAMRANRTALQAALTADFRKPVEETEFTEFVATLAELEFARKHVGTWMRGEGVKTPMSLFGASCEIRREPKGVVLILAPWNYPFYLTIVPLIAALAAGCRAIVRPSEKAPHTRAVLERIVTSAFRPDEVAIVGGEIETAEALLELPFDHVFFTGSTKIGKVVMRAAAEHLASVTLELGGKSPCIVDERADVAHAASRIAWGKYMNGGQTCVAPDYVLVHESQQRALLDGTRRSIEKMYGATEEARKATPDFCRMIDGGHFRRLANALDATVRGGARLEIGGATDEAERYIAPTVLSNVTFDAPIMEEEIFGPILPVIAYANLDDALAQINARPKPLALYLFSQNNGVVDRVLDGTSAGGTAINDVILHLANPNLPFGGVGESGLGSYHGQFGFNTFSHERAVLRQSKASLAPMLAPPYGKKTRAMIAMLERIG